MINRTLAEILAGRTGDRLKLTIDQALVDNCIRLQEFDECLLELIAERRLIHSDIRRLLNDRASVPKLVRMLS
jgi:hypothetical protein